MTSFRLSTGGLGCPSIRPPLQPVHLGPPVSVLGVVVRPGELVRHALPEQEVLPGEDTPGLLPGPVVGRHGGDEEDLPHYQRLRITSFPHWGQVKPSAPSGPPP